MPRIIHGYKRTTHKYNLAYRDLDESEYVGDFKELSRRTVHETDETSDQIVRIKVPKGLDIETIEEVVMNEFSHSCRCEHDCCGHTQSLPYTHTLHRAKGKAKSKSEYIFRLHHYMNV